ncbi:MAG: hypothetical protein WD057_13965 [Aquisalimonadaceae bacterium]
MTPTTVFWIYVIVLTALLFLPVRKIIWVTSVRRLQRKRGETLADVEVVGQKRRASFISFFLCLAFSLLFNISTLGVPHG